MKNSAKLLLFNMNEIKAALIGSLCGGMGIRPVKIYRQQYGEKIGALAGIPAFDLSGAPCQGADFSEEMMVMCFFEKETLDAFLDAYKAAGLPPIGLKAVLTPYNAAWSAEKLYRELKKEHQQINHLP